MKQFMLLTLISISGLQSGYSQSDQINSSFGINGSTGAPYHTLPARIHPSAVGLQSDWKILLPGKPRVSFLKDIFSVPRYNRASKIDTGLLPALLITKHNFHAPGTPKEDHPARSGVFHKETDQIPPFISLTNPANNSVYPTGSDIDLSVAASDADGVITKIEFYSDTTLLHTATDTPYTFKWLNVGTGDYTLTAKATDDANFFTTSDSVHISVIPNKAPSISLINPASHSTYLAGGNVYLTAAASDADGTISKVEFFMDTTLLHTATDTPYTFKWQKVNTGNYTFTAKATDNSGLVTTSDAIKIFVVFNKAPSVSIIHPANGETFTAPATVNLEAAALDPDGRIIKVDFYNETRLLNALPERKPPYTFQWQNVPAGVYTVTAVAQDNWGGITGSKQITVTVTPDTEVSGDKSALKSQIILQETIALQVSPNPAKQSINIYPTGLQRDKPTTLSILSASGVIFKTIKMAGSNQSVLLDVSTLVSGVYIIRMTSGDKILYRKFVKL